MALLRRVADRYKDVGRGLRMECAVSRTEGEGELNRKIADRTYRVFIGRDGLRVDVLGDGKSQITRLASGKRVIVYVSEARQYAESEGGDGDAAETIDSLTRSRNLFWRRYADLYESRPRIADVTPQVYALKNRKVPCQRLKIEPPESSAAKWNGEIWVEEATALVWRSKRTTVREG